MGSIFFYKYLYHRCFCFCLCLFLRLLRGWPMWRGWTTCTETSELLTSWWETTWFAKWQILVWRASLKTMNIRPGKVKTWPKLADSSYVLTLRLTVVPQLFIECWIYRPDEWILKAKMLLFFLIIIILGLLVCLVTLRIVEIIDLTTRLYMATLFYYSLLRTLNDYCNVREGVFWFQISAIHSWVFADVFLHLPLTYV